MSQSKRIVVLFLLLVTGGILIFVSTRNDKTGEQRFVEGAAIQPSTSESSPIQIAQVQTVATPLAVHEIYRGKISDHHWKEVSIYYENGLPYPLRKEQILHQNADGETTVKSSVSYVANHILLGFTGDEVPDSIKELGDLKPIKSIAGHSSYILVLKDWSLDTVAGLVSRFAEEPFSFYLRYAEPDFVQEARLLPNDPLTMDGTQWSLWNTNNSEDINAAGGWDIRTTANDVVVAVIDTGVDSGGGVKERE